jgi:hypothetical protein
VYYKDFSLFFDAKLENCEHICNYKSSIIQKVYALNKVLYSNDSIESINVFAYDKFDTLQINPIDLTDLYITHN